VSAALSALRADLARVVQANRAVREAAHEARHARRGAHINRLAPFPRIGARPVGERRVLTSSAVKCDDEPPQPRYGFAESTRRAARAATAAAAVRPMREHERSRRHARGSLHLLAVPGLLQHVEHREGSLRAGECHPMIGRRRSNPRRRDPAGARRSLILHWKAHRLHSSHTVSPGTDTR
jgi:hypothetical protein